MVADAQKQPISLFPITKEERTLCTSYMLEQSTGHPKTIQLVKDWIQRCHNGHDSCPKNLHPEVYPTRMLEIIDKKVRLIETQKSDITSPYVALSHCWGAGKNSNHLMLTSDNYSSLSEGTDQESLPATFRDAVAITENLGFRYLWIDSLCIIQSGTNKNEDWSREIRLMASVYSNCILNLAASDSGNSSAGIIRTRNVPLVSPIVVDLPIPVRMRAGSLRWTVTSEKRPHIFMFSDIMRESVGHFLLDTRAWVCQERLLAPRTVHFSGTQVFWECSETPFACESVPCGFPRNHTMVQTNSSFWALGYDLQALGEKSDSLLRVPPFSWKAQAADSISQGERWFEILSDYKARSLTVRGDMLPAIGAVAQAISNALDDKYTLGFFSSHLPQALLWQPRKPSKQSPKKDLPVAPSWSWASTCHPVDFSECFWPIPMRQGHSYGIFSSLKEITADLKDLNNSYGSVTGGSITIRAPIVKGTRAIVAEIRTFKGLPMISMPSMASRNQSLKFDHEKPSLKASALEKVHFMSIGWRIGHGRAGGAPYLREYGLLLTEMGGSERSYTRIGIFVGSHLADGTKTEEWKYKKPGWGYPERMKCDVRIV